jgi:hypothetical protein
VVDAELVRRRSMYQKDSRHTRAPGNNFPVIFASDFRALISTARGAPSCGSFDSYPHRRKLFSTDRFPWNAAA